MRYLNVIASAATVAGGVLLATAAGAAPLPLLPADAVGEAVVERVAGGCGPGFHPNPWGVCRPNLYGPRPFYGPRPVYGPRPYYRPYAYRPRPYYRPYGFYGPRPFF